MVVVFKLYQTILNHNITALTNILLSVNTTPDNFNIIGREDHGLARTIKESINIRVNNPTLNENIGKYNLHHIWDRTYLTPLTVVGGKLVYHNQQEVLFGEQLTTIGLKFYTCLNVRHIYMDNQVTITYVLSLAANFVLIFSFLLQ